MHMQKPVNSCGIYLDFDNIWGGILDFLSIKYDPQSPTPLTPAQKNQVEQFISELPSNLNSILPDIRFMKAFADFDRLPYAASFSPSITSILYNSEIEPHPSFVKAGKVKLKDASDRTLMLEIIEDVFFTKKGIDCVVIGSGDVDFYPIMTFLREHSDKKVSVLAFRHGFSSFYSKISYIAKDGTHMIDDIMSHLKATPVTVSVPAVAPTQQEDKFEKFKAALLKGVRNWESSKNEAVRTGLVISSWIPRWGITLTPEEIEGYFKRLKDDKVIDM